MHRLNLSLLPERLAVCQLPPDGLLPEWTAATSAFLALIRTPEELSIVCREAALPAGARHEPGWCALKVAGPLDFGLTGILAALAEPLARAGVSIFVLSTFNTDYVLVKQERLDDAIAALQAAGHTVQRPSP